MLIYNYQKEFLGIDEKDLKTLGFKDLAELRQEVTDFSDLFVKTPGYVHNFKHVHWIDFITCAESSEESKVIINVNNKNYKCVLQITTTFLVENPSSKAFIVTLNNLRELNASESERISKDITTREVPVAAAEPQQIFNTPIQEVVPSNATEDPYETPIEIDLDISDEVEEAIEETPAVPVEENFDSGYFYDPKVASDELGLPLDLIEEFIQDFIGQAKEFKADLYKALDEQDLDTLCILSHKLKGVVANLRVGDALEVLSIINTSDDLNVIDENLTTFYKIIAKLSGEDTVPQVQIPAEIETLIVPEIEEDVVIENPAAVTYSKEQVSNEIGIDIESFNELFEDYIEESTHLTTSIQSALENDDLQLCLNNAVKLKGMSDNMRITTLTPDLEAIIQADTTQDIQNNLNNIVSAIAELSN